MKTHNIKVKFNGYWSKHNDVYIIESVESYGTYIDEINNKFLVSENEIKNNKTWIGHGHSKLTGLSGMICGMIENIDEREPMLLHLKMLHGSVISGQLDHILKGNKIIINKNGGYFPIKLKQEFKIIKSGNHSYSKEDIKINKWWGGSHYYAKIGNVDVVDNKGNVKWNTEKRARELAVKYLNVLNND